MFQIPRSSASDPFLFDLESLEGGVAEAAVIRRGLAFFQENRVLAVGFDDSSVWADVEGVSRNEEFQVQIDAEGESHLSAGCTCDDEATAVCKHIVATFIAYSHRVHAAAHANAAEEAIALRRQRARTEVVVKHVAGEPAFGTWRAHTTTDPGAALRTYRVHIRSTTERINACSCPDFAGNRLGTCKHIEAVLHRLKRRGVKAPEPLRPVVHLSWGRGQRMDGGALPDEAAAGGPGSGVGEGSWPRVMLRRPRGELSAELARLLDRYFEPSGELRGPIPDIWPGVERELADRDDVHLGDDARTHAQRVIADLAHARRRDEIHARIARSGGRLPGVNARLYPYQVEGAAFLASAGRAILADDMGLGKTLQAIAASRWLLDNAGVERILVVCPASLKRQWAEEIERFTGMHAVVIEGGASPRLAQYRQRPRFAIVNYELVLRDLGGISTELAPDVLILDEAQRIKNWKSKTAAAIKAIESRYAFVLSGTPLENRLEELYSVMQVVDPRVLGPLWHFFVHHHVVDGRGKVVAYRNLSELRRRLAPVMLRRDKRLVARQLPDRIVQTVRVPMSARQIEHHEGALQVVGMYADIRSRRPLTPREEKEILAALQRARMACDAACLVDGETEGSPKLDELGRILEGACIEQGEKVVVFSQWERMTRLAQGVAEGLGLGVVRLHGGVPTSRRGDLIQRFRDDPECQVFLSTDAGSTGLNLQNASVFVNLDMPWNPAVLEQRIGRVHRLGQQAKVHAYLLISESSYEERVAELVRTKAELFGAVVEPDSEEEVVAVSGRVLDAALEALDLPVPPASEADEAGDAAEVKDDEEPESTEGEVPAPAPPAGERQVARPVSGDDPLDGTPLAETIALAQRAFGEAGLPMEAMVATPSGLVVLLARLEPAAVELAAGLDGALPVAAMDRRTWQALERMGHVRGELVATAESSTASPESPLLSHARRQVVAAEALLDQGMRAVAMGLMAEAMLSTIAGRGGQDKVPTTEAAVWLFGEAVPSGLVTAEIASAVLCAQGLARAEDVPAALAASVAESARAFILDDLG